MQAISGHAGPPTPSRFLTLPPELLTTVVRMAREQDDALAERLLISRERIQDATKLIIEEKRWYGKSLRALYATSRQLNELCRPLVWHTVKLSHASQAFFSDSLLLLYGQYIRHLDFDPCGKPSAFESLLISTLSMPNLDRLSFTSSATGRHLRDLAASHFANKLATICLRPALAALKPRITRLRFADLLKSADVIAGLKLWPNVTRLSRTVHYGNDVIQEGAEIAGLKSLSHLEIGSHWNFGRLNIETALYSFDPSPDWSGHWGAQVWPRILRTLSLASSVLCDEQWEFIASFGDTLEELNLELLHCMPHFPDDDDESSVLKSLESTHDFPRLHTLSFVGGCDAAREVLELLRGNPLRSVNLEIINLSHADMEGLLGEEGPGRLEPFAKSLQYAQIGRYGFPTTEITPYTSYRLQKSEIGFVSLASRKTTSTPSFSKIGEDFIGDEWESEVGSEWEISSYSALLSACILIDRIQGNLRKLFRENDPSRIDTLNLALRPLAALDLLDRD